MFKYFFFTVIRIIHVLLLLVWAKKTSSQTLRPVKNVRVAAILDKLLEVRYY